ncbi:hypothetical protein [Streptomyces sp. NPDC054849]
MVVWEDGGPDCSLAYDLPLLRPHDCTVPWSVVAGVPRQLPAAGPEPAAPRPWTAWASRSSTPAP